jgi:hypothetical protein
LTQHSQKTALPTEYNMKAGPVYFNVTGSVDSEFNDNIGLVNTGAKSDFLITPEVGLGVQWPVTQSNTLTLTTSLGYTKYLIHPQFDTAHILVSPGSALSFDIYTGDFKINLHDDFSYQQDPVNEGALSNVTTFDRFQNVGGISVLWDLNKVLVNLNYDHINFIASELQDSTGAQLPNPELLDYSADQVSGSVEVHASSTLVFGVESAASERVYDHFTGEYSALSAGLFSRVQITDHLKAEISGGYQLLNTPANSVAPGAILPAGVFTPTSSAGTSNDYYANLTFDHELNHYYTERLSLGHENSIGYLAEQESSYYVNYTGTWKVNRHLNLAVTLGYQDVADIGGLIGTSSYQYISAALQASFPITRSLSGAVLYEFDDKSAEASPQSYSQNRVDAILTYHF